MMMCFSVLQRCRIPKLSCFALLSETPLPTTLTSPDEVPVAGGEAEVEARDDGGGRAALQVPC